MGGRGEAGRVIGFLRSLVGQYYSSVLPRLPHDYPLREFAYQPWGSAGYVRHLAFSSLSEVRRLLLEKVPKHFYYSSARYEQPGVPDMDSKGWRSSDIVFDIDADHFPQCGERTFRVEGLFGEASLIDDSCIGPAAVQARILYDVLVEELGFGEDAVLVKFSGHRGFHIVVELSDDDVRARAGQEYRRELVNYVKCAGLRGETVSSVARGGFGRHRRSSRLMPLPPLEVMAGIRGRVARAASRFLSQLPDVLRKLYAARSLEEAARIYAASRREVEEALKSLLNMVCVNVDEQVTVDLKRLVRAADSINGKTGLRVMVLQPHMLEDFTLDASLSPFSSMGSVRVSIVSDVPRVSVLGHTIRFRRGDKPKLPAPLAVYLAAKGLAVPLEWEGRVSSRPGL